MNFRKFNRKNSKGILSETGVLKKLYTQGPQELVRPNHSTIRNLLLDDYIEWVDHGCMVNLTKKGLNRIRMTHPNLVRYI